MRSVFAVIIPLLLAGTLPAYGQIKPCEELKSEIAAKLDAKGVKNYTLTIVAAADVKEADTVVGSCDGSTKRIIYKRD